jgi:hypothetical protein
MIADATVPGVFVSQHQQFGVLAQVSTYQHGGQTEQTTQEPVQDRQQRHQTIIHDRPAREECRSRAASRFRTLQATGSTARAKWTLPQRCPAEFDQVLESNRLEGVAQKCDCFDRRFSLHAQRIHDHQVMLNIVVLVQIKGAGQLFKVDNIR